jgi:hypothetical protein
MKQCRTPLSLIFPSSCSSLAKAACQEGRHVQILSSYSHSKWVSITKDRCVLRRGYTAFLLYMEGTARLPCDTTNCAKGKQDSRVSKPDTSHTNAATSCQQLTEISAPCICCKKIWSHSFHPYSKKILLGICHHIIIEL